jgi:hypothetical protein
MKYGEYGWQAAQLSHLHCQAELEWCFADSMEHAPQRGTLPDIVGPVRYDLHNEKWYDGESESGWNLAWCRPNREYLLGVIQKTIIGLGGKL